MSYSAAAAGRRDVRRRSDASADTVADADFVARRTRDELLSRLELKTVRPKRILDAGAGTGAASQLLARRYRRARVFSLDISVRRLSVARRGHGRFARCHEVAGDATLLPLRDGCIDMVFANLLLPWLDDTQAMASEVARVLRPEGLFVFSSLGPDSFRELRESWHEVDEEFHVKHFEDMHEIGDALVRAGLRDPVLDVDTLLITYGDLDSLLLDLVLAGVRNTLVGRARGLATPDTFRRLAQAYERRRRDGRLPVTLELVYGHAWGGRTPARPDAAGEIRISAGDISRRS